MLKNHQTHRTPITTMENESHTILRYYFTLSFYDDFDDKNEYLIPIDQENSY